MRPLVSQRPEEDISMDAPVLQGVSIMGAAKGTTWVRVENLAQGTTAEDVVVSYSRETDIMASTSISINTHD